MTMEVVRVVGVKQARNDWLSDALGSLRSCASSRTPRWFTDLALCLAPFRLGISKSNVYSVLSSRKLW